MQLTVLDQSPVPEGSQASEALANSLDLARLADRLGYHRYWVAEHHNSTGLAGSAPEILIGHIAQGTDRIRVGSAGVMLSHYSPYKVAETFRVLEALHPGRIDLGIGRAPGSDGHTAYALARGGTPLSIEYFPNLVDELLQFLFDEVPGDSPLASVHARPPAEHDVHPDVWVLASSQSSAGLAAHFGLPLGWAHFIGGDGAEITDAYRRQYQPSPRYPEPTVSIAVAAVCADTTDQADYLASSLRSWRAAGLRGPIPAPQSIDPPHVPAVTAVPNKPLIVGTAAQVRAGIDGLAAAHGADEVAVVTITHDHQARRHSYELLATEYDLGG